MREFASQKALISYAERKGLIYLWEGTPAFARRQRLLSRDQYELAEVRTSRRGVRPAMLFPKAILEAAALQGDQQNSPTHEAETGGQVVFNF
jgi:hypothetical protein